MGFKQLTLAGLCVGQPSSAAPRVYYVSENGSGNGLTSGTPAPVSILSSASFTTDDEIYFKGNGDEYYLGDLTFPYLNGMTIGSFGGGAKPKIYGSQPISGSWTDTGGGIYSKVMAQAPIWIYKDDVAQKLASSSWIQSTAYPSTTIIRGNSATLNAFSNLVGAKIRIFVQHWIVGDELTITAYDSGTGNITVSSSYYNYGTPHANAYFIIYNQLQHVTENNEWYYDSATTTLYYKSSVDPSTLDIRAGYKNSGFVLTGFNYDVSGIEMLHFNHAIRSVTEASYVTMDDVKLTDCYRGSYLLGSNNSIINSEIRRCSSSAFYISGADCSAESNVVDTIGMNGNYPFGFASAFIVNGANPIIRKNTVNNCAYCGFSSVGTNYLMEKNVVTNSMKRIRDGGAIYTGGVFNGTPSTGIIRNNFCYDMSTTVENSLSTERAMGIYIDHTSNGIVVQNNTVIGGDAALLVNYNTQATQVLGNVLIGGIENTFLIREDTGAALSPTYPNNVSNIVEDNIFAPRSIVPCIEVRQRNNVSNYNPYASGGNADRNHYVLPYATQFARYRPTETGTITNYNLAGWQTKMGEDAASTARLNYITFVSAAKAALEIMVEMNPTDSPVNFNVPAGYSDYSGNAFSNPVSIPAWSSLAYFKDSAA